MGRIILVAEIIPEAKQQHPEANVLKLIPEEESPVLHTQNKFTKSGWQIPLQQRKKRLDEMPFVKISLPYL